MSTNSKYSKWIKIKATQRRIKPEYSNILIPPSSCVNKGSFDNQDMSRGVTRNSGTFFSLFLTASYVPDTRDVHLLSSCCTSKKG